MTGGLTLNVGETDKIPSARTLRGVPCSFHEGQNVSLAYQKLRAFLLEEMRMSHIYQPLMIKTLLNGEGRASTREIAAAFLAEDESQLEYYEAITKRMPGPVLQRRGIVAKNGDGYTLTPNGRQLSTKEIADLTRLCDNAVAKYKEKRGRAIWEHRAVGLGHRAGAGFDLQLFRDGELRASRRFANADGARFVAESYRQVQIRTGWTE